MSIIIIFGAPGSGKTTLNALLIKKEYKEQGRSLYNACCEKISVLNADRLSKLSFPDRPPIFSDFKVSVKVGYDKYFVPYFVDGFHLGFSNEFVNVINVLPYSKIHLSEVQRYYNSRESATFPDWVSRFYEMHRHFGVDIIMDIQRPSLVDVNIRELCQHFIEVDEAKHTYDKMGRLVHTTLQCREFYSYGDVDDYINNGAKNYDLVNYENDGDIYSCFESCTYFNNFVPAEGKDFNLLEFDLNNCVSEPRAFRHPPKVKLC